MRRDDVQRMKEQQMLLVTELRTAGQAAEDWKAENHEYDYRAEDKEKLEKISNELLSIQRSVQMHDQIET